MEPKRMPDNSRIVDEVSAILKAGKSAYGSFQGRQASKEGTSKTKPLPVLI
jgi:hypothetical protein